MHLATGTTEGSEESHSDTVCSQGLGWFRTHRKRHLLCAGAFSSTSLSTFTFSIIETAAPAAGLAAFVLAGPCCCL